MFITVDEIRQQSTLEDVQDLSDDQITRYMDRADNWILRATNTPYVAVDVVDQYQKDMATATWLLVEYLWYWDNPEVKEEAMSHDESIRIGTFSTNKKPTTFGDLTGVDELDSILKKYRYRPSTGGIFSILKKV